MRPAVQRQPPSNRGTQPIWSLWNDCSRCFRWSHISRARRIGSSSVTFSPYFVQLFRKHSECCQPILGERLPPSCPLQHIQDVPTHHLTTVHLLASLTSWTVGNQDARP
ncbi:uncharacterized protein LOC103724775 isoform X2 [Nannospalax galili]|uniref:uncharacterized protein LOC103724775 isoform X2 n=1 Tax=Nannospalax galili TaxID=1026970 RepID=UPI00111C5676|nr:uncharacterized protein LOC103724775 isoform X2 [Nannospalax galili]